jgi:hypothetical protein
MAQAVAAVLAGLRDDSPLTVRRVRDEVQARMSEAAGILCDADGVGRALRGARSLNAAIREKGISPGRAAEAPRAVQWRQMALASEAVLTALHDYIARGGGSRGARAILDPAGDCVPETARGALEPFRFRRERPEDREVQAVLRAEGAGFALRHRPNRGRNADARPVFERDWPAWLTGAIYRTEEG